MASYICQPLSVKYLIFVINVGYQHLMLKYIVFKIVTLI